MKLIQVFKRIVSLFVKRDFDDYNVVFNLPPKKRYTLQVEIKNIKTAKPRFVESDLFLDNKE